MATKRLVIKKPRKGYHPEAIETRPGLIETFYVYDGFRLHPCHGEAHTSPFIDGCMSCLGAVWGWKLVQTE